MNLLMVSPFYPSPTSGACTRVYHLLKALAHQYNVSLVVLTAATESDGEYPALDQMKLREVVKVPWPQNSSKRLQQAFSVLRGRSPRSEAYHIEGLQQVLDRLTARDNYDVVIFESVFLADYRLPHGTLVIIDQHDIQHELLYRSYQREKSLPRKWYYWWESRKIRPVELGRCRKAQGVLVTSEREASLLKSLLPNTMLAVVPNGVDTEAFQQPNQQPEIPDRIIYTGAMDSYPNVDAVLYFARECWPRIQSKVTTATWQIVGRNPPPVVQDLAKLPGISVVGSVPDVKPYLAAATVAIAPLLIGSGTRLKILEAFAMGKAVVSTSLGCEGLACVSGRDLMVADQPELFAQSVVDLLQDAARRTALGTAARAVAETYSWRRCTGDLIRAVEKVTRNQSLH